MKNSISKIYLLLFAAVLFFAATNSFSANVDVYNNAVLTGSYASLDLALAQVGVAPNTGVVQVRINTGHTLTASATIGNSNFISCKIFPTAAVTLSSALNAGAIVLTSADNVTIDGRLNGADVIGNGNSLTINCSNTGTGVRGIQTQNGSQNTTIRNVNINLPVTLTAVNGGRCINIGQSTIALQGGQDNAAVKYCNLSGGDRCLQTFGSPGIVANINQEIYGNRVRNYSTLGIFIGSDVLNVTCDSNEIYDDTPVYKGGVSVNSCRAIGMQAIGTVLIQNNRIHDITDNGIRLTSISIQGILCIPFRSAAPLATPVTNVTVQNNFVSLSQNNIKVTSIYGIYMTNLPASNGLDHNAKIYNNTALIGGTGSASIDQFTFGLIFNIMDAASVNSPSTASYYNNVTMNLREGTANSQHVGMDFEADPGVTTESDYNTCYSDGVTGIRYDAVDILQYGYNSTSSWRDANCPDYEQASAFHPVNYDANCQLAAPNYGDLYGKTGAGIPLTDIFGNTRAAVYPYRGAVEDIVNPLKVLTVTASLQGRAGALKSQMTVVLYDLFCNPVDYATSYIINGSSIAEFVYSTAITNNAPQYYLKCLTATNEESWSKYTVSFSSGTATYQFLSSADIYGDNGTPSGAFFAADVNQDGTIDASDLALVENDVVVSVNGCRVPTDINGDGIVDGSDLSFVDNNVAIGYSSIGPCVNLAANSDKINMNLSNVERVRLYSDSKVKFKDKISFINN